jgi:DNA-binding transcriptional LysR family regulator
MDETGLECDLLAIFVAVADQASFSKAAKALGVSKATVSRSIQRLETLVGAELLHRTTHAVALSTAGSALYERTAPHLRALKQALGTMPERDEAPSGELRLTAPHDVGTILLPELIAKFMARYPAVRCDLHLTNTIIDLVAERFDLAIRATPRKMPDSTLTLRKLGRTTFGVYASPSYVLRRGAASSLGDIKHDWVVMPAMQRLLLRELREFVPRVLANDVLAVRSLLLEGLGIGLLPRFVAEPCLTEGTLVRLLPNTRVFDAIDLALVYPSSGQVPRKVSALRDFLVEQVKSRRLDPA